MNANGKPGGVWTSLMVASAVGAVVGAGLALLFAPLSGRESRDWIARRTRDLTERVDGGGDAVKNGVIPS